MDQPEPVILVVEDDLNDQNFIRRAFKQNGVGVRILAVNDGEEATAYLSGAGRYADRASYPSPRLIMTDIKMPRMSGIELLLWMNARPEFRVIPAIILTSSNDQADINQAFQQGAKGYMIKPVQFGELEKLARTIADYWRASCVPR
jgi:CheY-like chemotaxis protein